MIRILLHWLASVFANIVSKSYHLTQIARRIVQVYDNDCNDDMEKNGEKKLLQLIASSSGVDSVFMDVGANVGDWSAALIGVGYTGRLVAVDPLGRNLSTVREKLTALNYSNFELCECALSDKVGKFKFFISKDPSLSGHDSLFNMQEIGYKEGVDCIDVQSNTLDELVKQVNILKIDFLKIDVEGNELSVLKGAKSLLSKEAIDFIQIEFGHASRAAHIYLHDIVNFVNDYKYTIFVIKPTGFLPLDFSPFTENRYSYINFLLAKNSVLSKLNGHILNK